MTVLMYKGGNVKGEDLKKGDPFTFVTQREFNEMGISVKLNALWSLKEQRILYITTNEMLECFDIIN